MSEFKCVSLGSGSKGNAILVSAGKTAVLVDCGYGIKELKTRLERKGFPVENLSAILVTHEHSDHSSGVARVAKKFQLPVYTSRGTSLHRSCESVANLTPIAGEQVFTIGDLEILPFTVPHDAREPLQFVFVYQGKRLGLITDVGRITQHIIEVLSNTNTLLLEFNHDLEMLRNSKYPVSLQRRIAGDYGHLNNRQSLELLAAIDKSVLSKVVALHLSEENNRPELVREGFHSLDVDAELIVADQSEGTDWVTVE